MTSTAPDRTARRARVASRAKRAGRNVLLLAAAMKLLDVGAETITTSERVGLAELALGVAFLVAYELTD
jgi:hypothetical protein